MSCYYALCEDDTHKVECKISSFVILLYLIHSDINNFSYVVID